MHSLNAGELEIIWNGLYNAGCAPPSGDVLEGIALLLASHHAYKARAEAAEKEVAGLRGALAKILNRCSDEGFGVEIDCHKYAREGLRFAARTPPAATQAGE